MSEFTFYGDPNFPNGIPCDEYAEAKKDVIEKKLYQTPDNNKIAVIEYCLEQLNELLEKTEKTIEQRIIKYKKEHSTKSQRAKANLSKEQVDNFNPVKYKMLRQQIQSVIDWLNAEQEFFLSIQAKQNNSQATKKDDLGSTQNLTLALMSLILKLESHDTSFDTSKLRDFIHLFLNKNPDNIKKTIENYKRMFLSHKLKNQQKKVTKNDKKSLIIALKKTKQIFEIIQLKTIIDQISDNIEELEK